MAKVYTFTGKSVDEALFNAASELNTEIEKLEYEVIENAKKGLFGIGACDAKIKVIYNPGADELAYEFLDTVLRDMGLTNFIIDFKETSSSNTDITVRGDGLGLVIGHHGETLDALQYLTNLAANKSSGNYKRYSLDIENYRAKREETLKKLAHKTAARALKQGRNVSLEPMSAYERRIIHAEVQNISGVTTFSVGSGSDRRVIVAPEQNASKPKQNTPRKPSPTYPGGGVSKQPIVKAKSIDEIDLADPDDSEII